MLNLNDLNGAGPITRDYAKKLLTETGGPLIGAEFGIAYGGGVEQIGKLWQGRGTIHGFDTFEGHPKQLAASPELHEAYCMDPQYQTYGMGKALTIEYQRAELDKQGLDNVVLHKGLIGLHSLDKIQYLNYALLDMDLVASMVLGWLVVSKKMESGGYLCLHDVLPCGHIPGLWGLYQEILRDKSYDVVGEYPDSYLAVLRKK